MKPFVRFEYQRNFLRQSWAFGIGFASQNVLALYKYLAFIKLGRRALWIDIWPKKVGT